MIQPANDTPLIASGFTESRQGSVLVEREPSRRGRRPVSTNIRTFEATLSDPASGAVVGQLRMVNFNDFLLALGVKDIHQAKHRLLNESPALINDIAALQWQSGGYDTQRTRGQRLPEHGDAVTLECALKLSMMFKHDASYRITQAARSAEAALCQAFGA